VRHLSDAHRAFAADYGIRNHGYLGGVDVAATEKARKASRTR
jgi:hypothetical protein